MATATVIIVLVCAHIVVCQFGFFQNQDRRYDQYPFQNRRNHRLSSILQFLPNQNSNSDYVYPFRRPISTAPEYEYGRPYDFNQNNGNFVVFPNQNRPPDNFGQNNQNGVNNGEDVIIIIDETHNTESPVQPPREDRKDDDSKVDETVANNDETTAKVDEAVTKAPEFGTVLPVLQPLPEQEKRDNYNFGSQGIFKATCETVNGDVGSCISIYDCDPYLKLLKESPTNQKLTELLRKAHCGFDNNNPKVCCPRPGFTEAPPEVTPAPGPEPTPSGKSTGDFVSVFPEPPECGFSNASFSRVVNGVNAKLGDFPWMAILGYKRNTGTSWLCGGSLVTHKHILTAAHCIYNHETDLYVVRLGELDLARDDEGATPIDVLIKTKIKHEQYDPKAFTNDIGLLILDTEVPFTELIKPICIPRSAELRSNTFVNYTPLIAGWGQTEFRGPTATHLQALQLPVVSNKDCAQAYVNYKNQKIDERVICAGYKKGGRDACQGDSGGPLMQPVYDRTEYTTYFYQTGIVSFGKECARPDFPGVYTRVTEFIPWLEEKIIGSGR